MICGIEDEFFEYEGYWFDMLIPKGGKNTSREATNLEKWSVTRKQHGRCFAMVRWE